MTQGNGWLRIAFFVLAVALGAPALSEAKKAAATPVPTQTAAVAVPATATPFPFARKSAPPTPTMPDLLGVSSVEAVRRMGLGWNLGNTMEACGDWIKGTEVKQFETAWGNPETTKEIIDRVRDTGFQSVRIPVAWSNLIGKDYTVDPRLLARVKQIADWVQEDGMIAMVNIHWDGGWWKKFPTEYDESMKHYTRIWTQVADYFKDEPGTLIFESLNEEGNFEDLWNRWGGNNPSGKHRAFGILNEINQTFVDLIRKSGGHNDKRHLLIAGYATDVDLTTDPEFIMPKDPANHLIVSVHYYTPYTFCGLEKDESWGKMRMTWGTEGDYSELENNFAKLKDRFIDKGVPIIIGEFGTSTKKDPESIRLWCGAVAEKAYKMGMCPMVWDAGQYLDRRKLVFFDPELEKVFQKVLNVKRDGAETGK